MSNRILEACELRSRTGKTFREVIAHLKLQMTPESLRHRVRKEFPDFSWKDAKWKFEDNSIHRTLIISDVHWEIRHRVVVQAVSAFVENLQPDVIVLAGDIYDNELMSSYPKKKKPKLVDLGDEIKDSASWVNFLAANSKKVIFLVGNHEDRAQRLLQREPGIPTELLAWPKLFSTFGITKKVEIFE